MALPDLPPQLTVVMPVYNEAACIESVLLEWITVLARVAPSHELLVYDDGSGDDTAAVLRTFASDHDRVIAASHSNRGHGPTVMRGYVEARGEWIFQTDSDGEMPASEFGSLWSRRENFDLILAVRQGRKQSVPRQLLSLASRLLTAGLFGRGVRDVNVPYRLMRGAWLREQLPRIAPQSAVPNVILSGLGVKGGARILELPVPHVNRRTGATSLNLRRVARLASRAALECLSVASGRRA